MRVIKRKLKNNVKETKGFDFITTTTGGFFSWRGNIYESDIIRAAIRPKVNAVGKVNLQHIRKTEKANNVVICSDTSIFSKNRLIAKEAAKINAVSAISNFRFFAFLFIISSLTDAFIIIAQAGLRIGKA